MGRRRRGSLAPLAGLAGLAMLGAAGPLAAGGGGDAAPAEAPPFVATTVDPGRIDADAMPVIALTVAGLPPGASVTVATETGDILGAYVPFGGAQDRATVAIPLPEGLAHGPVTLHAWVEEDDGTRRAPTEAELISVELQAMPVSR